MLDFKNVMCSEMGDVSLEGVGSRLYFDQNTSSKFIYVGSKFATVQNGAKRLSVEWDRR